MVLGEVGPHGSVVLPVHIADAGGVELTHVGDDGEGEGHSDDREDNAEESALRCDRSNISVS